MSPGIENAMGRMESENTRLIKIFKALTSLATIRVGHH